MGQLSTHVLDTALGKPAAAMTITLYRTVEGQAAVELCRTVTNGDGRTEEPLLQGPAFIAAAYELVFDVAPYFRKSGAQVSDPPFLDRVTLRFTVTDPSAKYHIPLLVSPWSYSTYRGS